MDVLNLLVYLYQPLDSIAMGQHFIASYFEGDDEIYSIKAQTPNNK